MVEEGRRNRGLNNIFVQSTSANRRLVDGTRFLYEVEDWAA